MISSFRLSISGLPKPAIVNQTKAIGLAKSFQYFGFNEHDIAYIVTPLYHSAATVLGFFNTLDVGMYYKRYIRRWYVL